ncbi:Fungal Zn2-Cys6 binuclear cluster domain-containing protein [Cladophialophora immunda]|nr:Fungal Zn2-Cys6 binuclear cluster domain-containing protein [Cladophialophora immunda]
MSASEITERGKKRRAGRACILCRARKVRCDAVLTGIPCTNCRLDSLACTVTKSKRHRVSKASKSGVHTSEQDQLIVDATSHQEGPYDPEHSAQETVVATYPGKAQGCGHGITTQSPAAQAPPTSSSSLEAAITPALPAFIKPLPDTLDSADLQYLHAKGALSLPSTQFLDVCIARYLEFTHPLLPLLEKRQLLSILAREEGNVDQISLLLFQAVMCSGVTFVEDQWIAREGFDSRQAARRAFFGRAKVLFYSNIDLDRLVACQAAVLLSTWYPGTNEKADPWFWTGTGVSLAYSMQLHLEPDESQFDLSEQHLRRRVWWCAFARDQKVALALGRPHRSTYYNVGMLTADDLAEKFQASPNLYPPETRRFLSLTDNQRTRDTLVRLCVEHKKLCVCIASFVSTIFKCRQEMRNRGQGSQQQRQLSSPSARLNRCTQDFARWYREIPADLRYKAHAATTNREPLDQPRSLAVHISTVQVLYHVAVSALYRLKALSPSSTWRDSQEELDGTSQRLLRHTAWELTRINQDLYQAGLMPYLSTGAVGSVVSAVVIHLLDVKAPNETVRRAAVHGIQLCKQFLWVLKDAYGTAVDALKYLREAEKQDAGMVINEVAMDDGSTRPSPPNDWQPNGMWLSTMLHNSPSAPSGTPTAPALETSPFKEDDEIFWQSWMESLSNYDFLESSNPPLYDLGFSSNDGGAFDIGNGFPGP